MHFKNKTLLLRTDYYVSVPKIPLKELTILMKTVKFNRHLLESFYGDQTDSVSDLLVSFVNDFSKTKQDLLSAFHSGKPDDLRELLHYHAPSFTYLGLPVLTTECRNLELKCIRLQNHDTIQTEFFQLLELIQQGKEEIASSLMHSKKSA
jgi:HPt (histidine-containing phosphotransfer) domain-containing protein